MKEMRLRVPAGREGKKEVYHAICTFYDQWVARFPLACREGCAACCTQSVSMTTLEGAVIRDFVKKKDREKWLLGKLELSGPGKRTATMTMNQFAESCLNRWAVEDESPEWRDFTPCIFLEQETCSIYEVRPFGCRTFGSLVRCAAGGTAEMAPIHLAVNTVFTQVIEHISSDGGNWAAMADILHKQAGSSAGGVNLSLLPARPIPGFLLSPNERRVIHALLRKLCGQFGDMEFFGDLIDNFLPI